MRCPCCNGTGKLPNPKPDGRQLTLCYVSTLAPSPPYSDEETSKAAARSLPPEVLSEMHGQILAKLEIKSRTCEELESALGLKHQTAGPRIWELRRWGKIRDSGQTRKGRSGRKAIIWEVTR